MNLGLLLYTWFVPPHGGFIVFSTASLTPGDEKKSFTEVRGAFFHSKRQIRDLLGSCDRISRETASSQEATILAMEILGGGSLGGWVLPKDGFLGDVEDSECPEDSPRPSVEIDQESATLMMHVLKSQDPHLEEINKYRVGFPVPWFHFCKYQQGDGKVAIICHTANEGSHLVFCYSLPQARRVMKEIGCLYPADKKRMVDDLGKATRITEHADKQPVICSGQLAAIIAAIQTAIQQRDVPYVILQRK